MIYVSTETKSSSGLGHGFYYNLNLSLIARTRQTDRGGSGTNIYILGVRIHIQESFFFSEILKELSKKNQATKKNLSFSLPPSLWQRSWPASISEEPLFQQISIAM